MNADFSGDCELSSLLVTCMDSVTGSTLSDSPQALLRHRLNLLLKFLNLFLIQWK